MTAGSWRSRLWPLKRQQLLRSNKPILVGPWLSEVGFETLYWTPFLERLIYDGVKRERIIPITRGGAGVWYHASRAMEIYGMRSVQDVRVEMRQRVNSSVESVKQLAWRPFERQLVKDAAETLGLTSYQTLHPRWMYHALSDYWEAQKGLGWLQQHVAWVVPGAPEVPEGVTLPEQFVAVRFYLRPSFSDKAKGLAKACVEQIARDMPVVLLHHDFFLDDHKDLHITGPNVYHLKDLIPGMTIENNLAMQSAILAKATAFVGTYGGFAQLALRYRKPTVSFYEDWQGTMLAHRHLADSLGVVTGVPFITLGIAELPMIQAAMPLVKLPKAPVTA